MHRPSLKALGVGKYLPRLILVFVTGLNAQLYAADPGTRVIRVVLSDYHFTPGELQLVVDQPVALQLINDDMLTPHNFTLEDSSHGLDVDVDVSAGETVVVHLMPLWPGRHTFYCSKKMIFMDSHREKGMEGSLIVIPK